MTESKPKKLFKVASEFNVTTQTIVDALASAGFEISNKPNSRVTPEMYQVLDDLYGKDKERSLEQERTREEYESRRNQILSQRNESVTIDHFLEPLDDIPLEPLDEKPEPRTAGPEELIMPEEDLLEPMDLEAVDEGPEESEEPLPTEAAAIPDVSESAESVEAAPQEAQEEMEAEETEEPAEPAERAAEVASAEETPAPEPESEEVPAAAAAAHAEAGESDNETEKVEEEDEEKESVIRGTATRLKGTKVIGKVTFTTEETGRKLKKRKRRKDRDPEEEKQAAAPAAESKRKSAEPAKGKKKRKGRAVGVDEEDVEKKMRETMQMMQSAGTAGSRRQKRRRQRREEREEELLHLEAQQEDAVLEVSEFITVSDLADLLDVSPTAVITTCMTLGIMVSINQRLDAATIELVAEEFGKEVEFIDADEMIDEIEEEEDDPEDLIPRAPIITVMGHVDHGKTSLLDHIRESKVAAGEAGGITQHVGAYAVKTSDGRKITFLDTPGHEAFTAMRSRGAQATDIVILVVAADDSVMPQTVEAINHSKAAGVPIVVAINKVDKPTANPDKIKQQLAEQGVIVEEYGGTTQCAEVSALTGFGIEELLEKVLIEAELMELKANPNRRATGVVLDSRVDKGKGTVANVLIQNGTLRIGDPFVAGAAFGRVRAMENEKGKRLEEAGPSTPIQLMGFDDIPQAGDRLIVPRDEKTAKEIAVQRQQIRREQALRSVKHLTLDELSRRMALGEISELNLIIKADVDGSIEALSGALQKLSTDEVAVKIIHTGSGAITESDVLLASASDGIIIGFQVRPTAGARKLAEQEDIDIRLFSVIYDAVDEVRDALEGMLSPEIREEMLGIAEVREIFRVSRVGTIGGCYVTEGKIHRNQPIRVIRDGVVIFDGEIDTLRRFKDDVREVSAGYECGISIAGYNDIKVGDEIECYEIVEEKRKLEDANPH